jgi:exonuclease III
MIGAFWNIRCLNKEGRLQCITDFVNDNKLDFVGFQETKKDSFNESFLKYIRKDFVWHFLPANGTAGGILVGVDERKFDVIAWKVGKFSVAGIIKNCHDNFVWRLVVVYGSPYEEGKLEFLEELDSLLTNWDGPTVLGGDFNITITAKEKNNGQINQKWANSLIDLINKWGLVELKNSSRSYTWTNN